MRLSPAQQFSWGKQEEPVPRARNCNVQGVKLQLAAGLAFLRGGLATLR